jgi:hypothetical protein
MSPLTNYGAEPFLRNASCAATEEFFQHFMEPEGSLICSQEPSTGPYSEPDEYSTYQSILPLQDPLK